MKRRIRSTFKSKRNVKHVNAHVVGRMQNSSGLQELQMFGDRSLRDAKARARSKTQAKESGRVKHPQGFVDYVGA